MNCPLCGKQLSRFEEHNTSHCIEYLRAMLDEMTEARDAAVLVAGVYQAQADGATARYEAMLRDHMEQI